ncbi:MAG: hypothetical protein ACLRVN_01950 [Butyricicoccus sp.]
MRTTIRRASERYKTEVLLVDADGLGETIMRRTRPNSKRGLPRSGFVRCSMKAFR